MTLRLGALTLPSGLTWSDEFSWNQLNVTTEYSLTGALIVDTASKQAGRSITLTGGINFGWITRSDLLILKSLLENCPDTGIVLTLHDGRTFNVVPNIGATTSVSSGGSGGMSVKPVPVVGDSGPANPSNSTYYYIETLSLFTV